MSILKRIFDYKASVYVQSHPSLPQADIEQASDFFLNNSRLKRLQRQYKEFLKNHGLLWDSYNEAQTQQRLNLEQDIKIVKQIASRNAHQAKLVENILLAA